MNQVRSLKPGQKAWLIIGPVLLLIAAALVFIYLKNPMAGQSSTYQTEAASRGRIHSDINATGTLRARQSVTLKWQTSGHVEQVNVETGQSVNTDQVLASLSLDSAPADILLARASMISAQQNLDSILQSNSSLADAQKKLADAKQKTQDAQDAYDTISRKRVTDELISDTADSIEKTRDQLKFLNYIYGRFYDHRIDGATNKSTFVLQITYVQQNLDALIAKYNWYTSKATPLALEQSLTRLNLAKAQQEDAQRELDRISQNGNGDNISTARAKLAAARSTVDKLQVTAPFAGTITQSDPKINDDVNAGQIAFRLDDLSQLLVDLQISEVDVNSVSPGQPVSVSLDAIPDKTFNGVVSRINQSAVAGKQGVNFLVSVTLTDTDKRLKPGMSASVGIVVKDIEDALIIPARALRYLNGERIVYVLKDNQPVPTPIRTGASSGQYIQVVGGSIQPGDSIILNPPAANQ